MKKIFLLIVSISLSVILRGQEHEFEYIKEDIFFHKPAFFEPSPYDHFFTGKNGSSKLHYEGWIDSTGTPMCYGKIVEGINNELIIGQITNGKFDGWCYSSEIEFRGIMKWSDSLKSVTQAGWGRSDIPLKFVQNPAEAGLAITKDQNYYITEQGTQLNALSAYRKFLYDDQKSHIKQVCAKKGLKYVEDVRVGKLLYTGGWKDGQPYVYGAYKDAPDNNHRLLNAVFCGHFTYNPNNITFTADNKGSYTEYHHVTYDPFVYHQHTITIDSTTSQPVVFDIDINFNHYYMTVSDTKKGIMKYELILFEDGLYSKGSAFGNHTFWGIFVGRYDFYEGKIASRNGYMTGLRPINEGKFISNKGDFQDATIGESKSFTIFANGDSFYQEIGGRTTAIGDYTFADGSYIVGQFLSPNGWMNEKEYKPIYAEAYDKNGEIIKSYVDNPMGLKPVEVEKYIQLLKKKHATPLNGYGEENNENYRYEGEFYGKLYHGKGKLSNKDGSFKEGVWRKGDFVFGTAHYTDKSGEYMGEMKGSSPHGIGKFIYNDGTYRDGTWNNGDFVSGTAHIKNTDGEYIGEMKGTAPYGKGKSTYNNGSYKEGTFEKGGLKSGEIYMIYDDGTSFKGIYELFHAKEGTFTTSDGTKVIRTWNVSAERSIINDYVDIIYPNGSEYHGPCYKTIIKDGNKREYSLEGDHVTIVDTIGNRYMGGWGPMGRVGNGVDVFTNGDSINTSWQDNVCVLDAEFAYTWSDGRKFVGIVGKKGKIGKGTYFNPDGSEASKKDYKNWVMQTPTTMDIHVNPVKRNFP